MKHLKTIKEIVDWLRERICLIGNSLNNNCQPRPTLLGEDLLFTLSVLANDIETAHKREIEKVSSCSVRSTKEAARIIIRNGVVNAAKMYEALANISKYADCAAMRQHDATTQHYIEQIRKWAKAALAAPPRNCDAISEDAVKEGFRKEFEEEIEKGLPITEELKALIVGVATDIITSLYATHKEDEAEQEEGGEG